MMSSSGRHSMRKGRSGSDAIMNGMQESAPPPATSPMKKSSSSHHRKMAPMESTSHHTPVTNNHHTYHNQEEEPSKNETGWHTFIQTKDWVSLQRYLEQLASPPIPQMPHERHSHNMSSNMTHNSHSERSSNKSGSKARDSGSHSSNRKKGGSRRASAAAWLKRSVASMGTSMGNMSGRTHTARTSDSVTAGHHHDAIEEMDDEDHSGEDAFHLDKESLLISNAAGRTPLQLTLNTLEAPDHMVLHLLRAQPKAVAISDTKGRLPLHFAVVRKRRMETVAELVELFPDALHQQDQKGKTPVSYAIEVAKRQTNLENAPRTFWASPPSNGLEVKKWQFTQHQQWEMARWLLQTSASLQQYNNHTVGDPTQQQFTFPIVAVDHQHPFLIRNGARSQQHVLIEVMLHAAPPTVVALLVEASSKLFTEIDEEEQGEEYQQAIVSMGCSAFYLAIFRQYPLEILRRLGSLLEHWPEVKTVRDETGLGLVSAHYVTSCFEKSKLLEYVAEEEFMVTMEQCIVEGQLPEDNIPFLEWWDKLKYLIFFCADKNPDTTTDDYLLHAALENTDTPPNVIRLLLALYPGSARQPDAQSAHPLHLFAKHRDYIPRNYESPYMHGLNVMDMLLSLDESAVFHNFQKRLPLHHAIASGRTWSTIHPIVSSYRSSLRMQDPITKLYPAQLAAAYREDNVEEENTRLLQLTRNQYSAIVWQGLSQRQQANAVARIRQFESLKRLDTIFELFRRYPQCVEAALETSPRQSKKKKKEEKEKEITVAVSEQPQEDNERRSKREKEESAGPEMITFHYLSWCYKKVGGVWHVVPENMEILQAAIQVAVEHRVLSQKSVDFVNWWGMLKMYFWHCYNATKISEKLTIPKDDDNYLLHLAVSIPTTPPDLIELILGLYPESASAPLPNSTTFPLHLACGTTTYTPQYFEVVENPSTLQLVLESFPEATFVRSGSGQTPLQIAIQTGKTYDELLPLIEQVPTMVSTRDQMTGLFPYQAMALAKPLSSDLKLRFRTIAANRHSDEWSKFSGQRKMKEIKAVEKEYQRAVLDSTFELLRLVPDVITSSEIPAAGEAKPASRSSLRPPRSSSRSSLGMESFASSVPEPKPTPSRARKRGIRRIASGVSRDSSVGGGSAFSTIDMMSTISNVSSHLSFRRASSISDGKLSGGSMLGSDSKLSGGSMLGDDHSDDESEDSDIWSEDVSFQEDEKKAAKEKLETQSDDKNAGSQDTDRVVSSEPRKSVRQQKMKSKWTAPTHFGAEEAGCDKEANPVDRNSIPKVIVEPSDVEDDVSFLDNINPRSRSMSGRSSLRRTLLGDSLSSSEEEAWVEANRDSAVTPDDLKATPEPQVDADDHLQSRRRSTVPMESTEESHPKAATALETEDWTKQPAASSIPDENEDEDINSDDDSIHDEIVSSPDLESKGGETAEDPVVVFRIRKTSCQRPSGPMRSKARSESLGGSRQSGSMDFLSILNASLPEGKMDYLSTLGVSSDSLPPVSDSVPTGLDAHKKFTNLGRIQEFPSESDHSAIPEPMMMSERGTNSHSRRASAMHDRMASSERGTNSHSRRATVAALPSKLPLSPSTMPGPDAPSKARSISPKAPNSRRRASQISPKRVRPEKVETCLICEIRSREVILMPCGHLCICRVCAIEEDIKSCAVCFGPVRDKKVQKH